jgi:predicted protein tyrosine phosphatase
MASTRLIEILPWLFVSDQKSAELRNHLTRHQIERVVSVMDKYDHLRRRSSVDHHIFHVSDMDTENILPVAEAVYKLLEDQKRTVVHCFAGQSRSVSVVAYYLRRSGHCASVREAFERIEAAHGDTWPNPAFVQQIANALDRGIASGAGEVGYGAAGSTSESSFEFSSESASEFESRCSQTLSSTLDSLGRRSTDQPSA